MPVSGIRPILVLGGDGYLGWPLSLRLARENSSKKVVLVDNLLRRRLVKHEGGDSLLPILTSQQRLEASRSQLGLENMEFIHMDVNSPDLELLIGECQPDVIYHLAQQGSAPYSMRGPEQAMFTVRNNEEGNMRLLWAVKNHAPDCHIVKLGSFGEYATSGMDIAEGYFRPAYGANRANRPVPYPREADDFYHATKINDTNHISVACRIWGLRVTDIMQCTVFGSWTPEIDGREELFTRLDYDECFGTVANRFLAQALCGQPLTVYGTGHQRTGLMSLNDTVQSLTRLREEPPPSGEHRVINHLTEESYSINELAETVRDLARQAGFPVEIQRGVHDPRGETLPIKLEYHIEHRYVLENLRPATFAEMVARTLRMLVPYRERIEDQRFAPKTLWNGAANLAEKPRGRVVQFDPARGSDEPAAPASERAWERFRREHFPYRHLNLNPGTLGSPSSDVLEAVREFQSADLLAHPLAQYKEGRAQLSGALDTARQLWPSEHHALHVSAGASACSNLLALCLARLAGQRGRPLRVLTTAHEHIGGLGAFERMPEFETHYLSEIEMRDQNAFEAVVQRYRPDVAFFSHVAYDSGQLLPVGSWSTIVKRSRPDATLIIDVSQSLGLRTPPFEDADVLFGSGHKWLFGPRGTGLLWTNDRFRATVAGMNWSGEPLLDDPVQDGFALTGGVDFSAFAGLRTALELHRKAGGDDTASGRSAALCRFFAPRLDDLLTYHGIEHRFVGTQAGPRRDTGVLTVSFPNHDPYPLYRALDQRMVHAKCIKDRDKGGKRRQLLRFGMPYYESAPRLREALSTIDGCLGATNEGADRESRTKRKTL